MYMLEKDTVYIYYRKYHGK